jgi:tetratricopeptide (TPR) repeat protein
MWVKLKSSCLGSRRRGVSLLLLLALLGVGGYFGWQYARIHYFEPRGHWQAAEQALERRAYGEALAEFRFCADAWPKDAATQFQLARTARRAGQLDEAEQYLARCRQLQEARPDPGGGDTALEWALLQAQRGNLASVESTLRARVEADDADATLILDTLSAELIRNNRLPEARVCLDGWLRRRPEDYDALVRRAWVAEHLFDRSAAADDFFKALRLEPDQDLVRIHLVELLLQENRLAEAAEHVDFLRRRQPDNPAVLVSLARIKRAGGAEEGVEEARKLLAATLAKNPRHAQALSESGMLELDAGRNTEAEPLLREALKLNPTDRPTLYNLTVCLERLGKKQEARELTARLAKRDAELKRLGPLTAEVMKQPENLQLRYDAGMILLNNGYTDDGLRWLSTVLKRDPHHRATRQALVEHYTQAGDPERAAFHRRFLQTEP